MAATAEQIKTINDFDAEVKEKLGITLGEAMENSFKFMEGIKPGKSGKESFFRFFDLLLKDKRNELEKTELSEFVNKICKK